MSWKECDFSIHNKHRHKHDWIHGHKDHFETAAIETSEMPLRALIYVITMGAKNEAYSVSYLAEDVKLLL